MSTLAKGYDDSDNSDQDVDERVSKDGSKQTKSQHKEGYTWEGEYQRSWDIVKEDAEGSLAGVVEGLINAGKRKRYINMLFFYFPFA